MADTIKKDIGAVSAYALAVEGGYTGTEEQFKQDMANFANNVTQVANDKTATAESAKTAVAAAAAAQKSADEAAESAKEAAEGGGVQSDYAQNDPTAKDYIKNRPGGYEERFEITWDGDTTGKVLVQIFSGSYACKVSDNILTADQILGGQMTIMVTGYDAQSYTITSDIVEESEDAVFINSFPVIVKNPGEFVVMDGATTITLPESGVYFYYINDGQIMYLSSISNLSPLPFEDKYIPNTICRKNEVYAKNELYTKDEVYAKNEVYTKDEVYTKGNQIISITWDGSTDGKDTLKHNAFDYYKMSDVAPDFKQVKYVTTSRSSDSATSEILYEGENCYKAGFGIVVTKAGACKLAVSQGDAMKSFTAPSAGIYFWSDFNTNRYQTGLELSFQCEQGGVIVKSQTKTWAITVDDSGNISAVEITE